MALGKRFMRPDRDINGEEDDLFCPVHRDWPIHREEIKAMQNTMQLLLQNTQHLSKLNDIAINVKDVARTNHQVVAEVKGLKEDMVGPATGKDQIQTKTAHLVFRVFGWVIIGLVAVIVFLLTGEKFGWIGNLAK